MQTLNITDCLKEFNYFLKASKSRVVLAAHNGRVFHSRILAKALAVFSRRRMSRLTFQKVFCLQTKLSDLKLIGVFTSKIITFHFGNLRRARANKSISIIWRETEKMVACTSYFFSLLCLCGWLSSDGGADFNKGCDCSQLEAG